MTCVDAIHWSDPSWPDKVLSSIVQRPIEAPVARPGSLWLSRSTGRRGALRWASQGSVRLDFSDTDETAYVILAERDLTKLYIEAK